VGQSIVTAGNVVVKVVSMDQGNVRLGIDAPREISVNREEIQRQREVGVPTPDLHPQDDSRTDRVIGIQAESALPVPHVASGRRLAWPAGRSSGVPATQLMTPAVRTAHTLAWGLHPIASAMVQT